MKTYQISLSSIIFLALSAFSTFAKPCVCKDIKEFTAEIRRVSDAEAAWMEIFAWARGLHSDVAPPKSNDELNTKFLQLSRTPRSDWDRVMHEPIQKIEIPEKAGSMDQNGEPIVNETFKQAHCDDIVEGVRVHERAHREFFLSLGNLIQGKASAIAPLLSVRSESEVVSYRKQKVFLTDKLEKLKCDNQWKGTISYTVIKTYTTKRTILPKKGPMTITEGGSENFETTETYSGSISIDGTDGLSGLATANYDYTSTSNYSIFGQVWCSPRQGFKATHGESSEVNYASGTGQSVTQVIIRLEPATYSIDITPPSVKVNSTHTWKTSSGNSCDNNKPLSDSGSSNGTGNAGPGALYSSKTKYGPDINVLNGSSTITEESPVMTSADSNASVTSSRSKVTTITWSLRRGN